MNDNLASQIARLTPEQRQLLEIRRRRRPVTEAPLSPAQERLWFLDRLDPGSPALAVMFATRLTGPLDRTALRQALDDVVARQSALRTAFHDAEEGPRQRVLDRVLVELPVVTPDAGGLTGAAAAHAVRRFDLTAGAAPLCTLVETGPAEHVLLTSVHHIVFDGWSVGVFQAELAGCYARRVGEAAALPALPVRFIDHAVAERAATTDPEHLRYWRARLAGAPELSTVPPDLPRPPAPTRAGAHLPFELPADVTDRLTQVARREGASLNSAVLAVFGALLHGFTGAEDVLFGVPVARRTRVDVERLVGCFADIVVVRLDLSGQPTGRALIRQVHRDAGEAYAHQAVPFTTVVEHTGVVRSPRHNPLFQVMLSVNDVVAADALTAGGLELTAAEVESSTTDFDLFLTIRRTGSGLSGVVGYNTDLYLTETAELVADRFRALLTALADDPDRPLDRLVEPRRRRVDLAASFSAEPLGDTVRFWSDFLRLPVSVDFAAYGQVVPRLLAGDPAADATVVLLRWADNHRPEDLLAAVRAFRARSDSPLVIVVCPGPDDDGLDERFARGVAGIDGVEVCWAENWLARLPVERIDDPAAEELGNVPYTDEFFAVLGTLVVERLRLPEPGPERAAYRAEHLDTAAVIAERARVVPTRPAATELVAPRTPTEERLVALWRDLLGTADVGVTTSFFGLGGHSLLATRLLSRLRTELGVGVALHRFLLAPTVAELAGLVDAAEPDRAPARVITPVPRDRVIEATSTQHRLWALSQLDGRAGYGITFAATLHGELDEAALTGALDDVVDRHEVLRTTFAEHDGRPRLAIAERADCWLPPVDPRALDDLVREHATAPYDLGAGPLLRARLVRSGPAEHHLLIGMHHIICDNRSWHVFLADLSAAYRARLGAGAPLEPLPVQYADYAAWQRDRLAGAEVAADVAYWRDLLRDAPTELDLGGGHAGSPGGTRSRELPGDLGERVRRAARAAEVTPFVVLLAAYALMLHRESGRDDLVVGVPAAGRDLPDLANLIGYFADLLPFRLDLSGRPSVRRLLRRVHGATLAAQRHRTAPLATIVDAVNPPRDPARHPLFQHVLNVVEEPTVGLDLSGIEVSTLDVPSAGSEFDLFVHMSWKDGRLTATAEHRAGLFDADRVDALLDRYVAELATLTGDLDSVPFGLVDQRPDPLGVTITGTGALEPVRRAANDAAAGLAVPVAVRTTAPGTLFRTLLDPAGPLGAGRLGVVVLRWPDLLPDGPVSRATRVRVTEQAVEDLRTAVRAHRVWSRTPLLLVVAGAGDGLAERLVAWLRDGLAGVPGVDVRTADGGDQAVGALVVRRLCQLVGPPVRTVVTERDGWGRAELGRFIREQHRHGRQVVVCGPGADAGFPPGEPAAVRLVDGDVATALAEAADPAGCLVLTFGEPVTPGAVRLPAEPGERGRLLARLWALDAPFVPPDGDRTTISGLPMELAGAPTRAAERAGTDTERTLAAIWAELLSLDAAAIDVHQDFYALGGDSMLAIQAVFRANVSGIALTPAQFADRPTIAGQAALEAPVVVGNGEPDAGEVPLTLPQQWFLANLAPNLPNPSHFNTPCYLSLRRPVPAEVLRAAVAAVVAHHDALRLRLSADRRQTYADAAEGVAFESHDLTSQSIVDIEEQVTARCVRAQASLSLTTGPLVRGVHFALPDGQPDRLLLVIHHWVVDGVSRDVLLDDLQTACRQLMAGEAVRLPPKAVSYQEWARRLAEHAASPALHAELPLWLDQKVRAPSVPRDFPDGRATFATRFEVDTWLDERVMAALRDRSRAHHTNLVPLLVHAVGDAVTAWTGGEECGLWLSSHGRTAPGGGLDVFRTVGWFQHFYPFRVRRTEDVGQVAERLAGIPDGGIGWGLARYLSPDPMVRGALAALPTPEISLNFTGHFDWTHSEHGGELFDMCQAPYGLEQDEAGVWPHTMDVMAGVLDNRLRLCVRYSANLHRKATAEHLLAEISDRLVRLSGAAELLTGKETL